MLRDDLENRFLEPLTGTFADGEMEVDEMVAKAANASRSYQTAEWDRISLIDQLGGASDSWQDEHFRAPVKNLYEVAAAGTAATLIHFYRDLVRTGKYVPLKIRKLPVVIRPPVRR